MEIVRGKKGNRREEKTRWKRREEEKPFFSLSSISLSLFSDLCRAIERALSIFGFNCSTQFSASSLNLLLLAFLSFLKRESNQRTLKLSLGGIGASPAAAGAARGGMPVLLGGAAAEEASGGAAAAARAAMLLLSAEATFLPAARAGEGCGEGDRDGEAGAAGSLAGQSGRIGERKREKRNRFLPSISSLGRREERAERERDEK